MASATPTFREHAGEALGQLLAPMISRISRARHARMFHPDGRTFAGHVTSSGDALGGIGGLLAGPALARFSGALWRRGFEHFDPLGIALRFRSGPDRTPQTFPDDQDLLFATIVSPFTMPFAPFTTNAGDFFANHYWAVSPFDLPGGLRVKFRISPLPHPAQPKAAPREVGLVNAVAQHQARWAIEARPVFSLGWRKVATLTLDAVAHLDQQALRFSAFNCGRGIVPRGLVHAMRRAAYPASQRSRPAHEDETTQA